MIEHILWYRHPAREWTEALPIGNGKIGAMVYGCGDTEIITLNEDTFWAGYPKDKDNGKGYAYLERARELLRRRDYGGAQKAVDGNVQGENVDGYLPVGTLQITFQKGTLHYGSRQLDLETGVHTAQFTRAGVQMQTAAFVHKNEPVLAVEVKSEEPRDLTLTFDCHFEVRCETRPEGFICRQQAPEKLDGLTKEIVQGNRGMWCDTAVLASSDGQAAAEQNKIIVTGACKTVFYVSIITSYRGMREMPDRNIDALAWQACQSAAQQDYILWKAEHKTSFAQPMRRLELNLDQRDTSTLPTGERLHAFAQGADDPAFAALYLQYGRYLMLSGSSQGMPLNLQGIWNKDVFAAWSCDYTVNINLPMNYWLAEPGNLADCHEVLFSFMEGMREVGETCAKRQFGCQGYLLAHNSDVWGSAAPVAGNLQWSCWVSGGAWLCQHVWNHYLYGLDKEFLKNTAYPLIRGAVAFLLDYLAEDGEDGLMFAPSTSPENEFLWKRKRQAVTRDSAMDITISRELLQHYLECCTLLHVQDELTQRAGDALQRLPILKVGPDGRLLEWNEAFAEAEPGHRHFSHLYGLYPGQMIHEDTPELRRAAARSLDSRIEHGSGYTGWSAAWAVCLYARLRRGERAHEMFRQMMKQSTFDSLLDSHPPEIFQIDGNFGAAAGILELLVQSRDGVVDLLPALPPAWQNGYLRGVRVRGGAEVELAWERGELKGYTVWSKDPLVVRYKGNILERDGRRAAGEMGDSWVR